MPAMRGRVEDVFSVFDLMRGVNLWDLHKPPQILRKTIVSNIQREMFETIALNIPCSLQEEILLSSKYLSFCGTQGIHHGN